MINQKYRSKIVLKATRSLTLVVIVGFICSCFQPAWADVDAETIKKIEDTIKEQKNYIGDFSSWVIIANEVDNLIKMKCNLPNLSENCKNLRDLFIEKSREVFKKSSAYETPSHAYAQAANAKKFQQKTMKIVSYGKSPDLGCNGPNLPLTTKEVEKCLPRDLSQRILDSTSLDPDVTGMIVNYTLPPKDIEIQSFKKCAELNSKDLGLFNIRFSSEMRDTIKAILHRTPPVEDLLSDFEGTRDSSKGGQEEKQPVQIQSAKSALLAHMKAYPNHQIEKWDDIKNCFIKFKNSQTGVSGVDLDFTTTSSLPYELSAENVLMLLEQYFISESLKNLTIGDLTGESLERFLNLLTAEKVKLDSLRISLGHDDEKTKGLIQIRKALLDGRLKVKQLSLLGNPLLPHIREYNKELKELIEDPKIHLEGLEIYLKPVTSSVTVAVSDAIKKNSTLKSIRVVEDQLTSEALEYRLKFIEGLKENHSIRSVEFQPKDILRYHHVNEILNAFKKVLDTNKTLTDLRTRISFGNIRIGYIDLHIHHGKLVGVENAKGLVRYEVLKDFPAEFRPVIQEVLVRLNRNAQNAMKNAPQEKKALEEKEEREEKEEKKSDKKSVHGLGD